MTQQSQRILLIGASGTIGQAVMRRLSGRHEVVTASSRHGDIRVDITDPDSITKALTEDKPFNAVIAAVGGAVFAPLDELDSLALDESPHRHSLEQKLLGQINLAQIAKDHLVSGGSITLTSGILNETPVPGSISSAMVNGGLEAFVRSAATEMPRGIRINIVSPGVIRQSYEGTAVFAGLPMVEDDYAALGYERSVESLVTGQVITRWGTQ